MNTQMPLKAFLILSCILIPICHANAKSPFVMPETMQAHYKSTLPASMHLAFISTQNNNKMAVINGHRLFEGNSFEGYTIETIEQNAVILQSETKGDRIKLTWLGSQNIVQEDRNN